MWYDKNMSRKSVNSWCTHPNNGSVVYHKGKFYIIISDRTTAMKPDEQTGEYKMVPACSTLYIDPFKQPDKLVEGVVDSCDNDFEEYISEDHFSSWKFAEYVDSSYGFLYGGKIIHIPIPPFDKDGNRFESFDAGVRYFFNYDHNKQELVPK